MQKIKTTSRIISLFFYTLCWVPPFLVSYFILFHFNYMLSMGYWRDVVLTSEILGDHFSFLHRFIILLIQFLPLSIGILIYNKLAKLFQLYEQGILFETENIILIRDISIFLIIGELIGLIYEPLICLALSYNNPIGKRFWTITFSSTNVSTLVTAFIILVASWIVKEAHQLKADAELTV